MASSSTYNADNEQTKFGGISLSYDLNGDLTGDGTNTYTWDARNHLTAISGGVTASFVYDPFGRRASKTISSTTTQFLYDRLNPVQELSSGGSPSVNANLLNGLGVDEYFTRTDTSSNVSTFLADALGSTVGLASSGGSIATSYSYEPFGNVTASGSANGNSYQFTGRENDGTGSYFYRARYYSPMFQRFKGQDQIGFRGGDANLYGYAFEDPVLGNDPLGLADCTCPASPAFPAGESVDNNLNQVAAGQLSLATAVRNMSPGGSMDYKTKGPGFDAAGNFNFGGSAMHMESQMTWRSESLASLSIMSVGHWVVHKITVDRGSVKEKVALTVKQIPA